MMSFQSLADLTTFRREEILRETEGERLVRRAARTWDGIATRDISIHRKLLAVAGSPFRRARAAFATTH